GTSSLLDAIAADAAADVRLSTPVRRIRRDDEGVSIDLASGGRIETSAAIVTLPINVWRDVEFDPPLAGPKQRAAREGHVGRTTKALAVVDDAPPDMLAVGWHTPFHALISGRETPGGRLVTGFAADPPIDPRDPVAVAAAVAPFLPDARVIACDGHDWNADPWSRGTWLTWPPGWASGGMLSQLGTPEGRLAFAGSDVSLDGAGWMEGAVSSGRRAAAHIAANLRR
ncbi:MAG: flavin monoamine oxidase family protein, partial [Actinomycetota bacterium]